MTKNTGFLIFISLVIFSCKKENQLKENNSCTERKIVSANSHLIDRPDIALVNNLFIKNGIDKNNFRYFQYTEDSIQTYFPPYDKFDSKIVRVDQFTNGLRIFNGDLVFSFKNDIFNYRGGSLTSGTKLNNIPNLNLTQLRKLFIDDIKKFNQPLNQNNDTCLYAEFGYFNLNAGTGNITESLIKAWRIKLKNSVYPSEYPEAYYQDNDGKLIYFDNGIRTFK
jgi:hypothetical protein